MKYIKSIGLSLLYPLIVLISMVISQFLCMIVLIIISPDKQSLISDPELLTEKIMSNVHFSLLLGWAFALSILLIITIARNEKFLKVCKFNKTPILYIVFVFFLSIPLNYGINIGLFLIEQLLKDTPVESIFNSHEELISSIMNGNFILIGLSVGILVPICEEILFRGFIQNELGKVFGVKLTIIIQAILFGLYHLEPLQILYATFLGLVFGIIKHFAKSIWASIVMHTTFNSTSFLLSKLEFKNTNLFELFYIITLSFCILISIILFSIIVATRINNRNNIAESNQE